MLCGVCPDLQRALAQRGYRVRAWLPFGTDWFPYAIRRIGESPATCDSPSAPLLARYRRNHAGAARLERCAGIKRTAVYGYLA
jgi:hypothetical protein